MIFSNLLKINYPIGVLFKKKRMFGIVGIYKDGLMFGIISNQTVYLRVDKSNRNKFINAGSTSLKVFKTNSEVPSYYELPPTILDDSTEFIKWANESYEIQIKLNREFKKLMQN